MLLLNLGSVPYTFRNVGHDGVIKYLIFSVDAICYINC